MIESKQCEDELDLIISFDYIFTAGASVAVLEDEGGKKERIIAGSKSFTLCNRSTNPFNDHRNYVASAK